MYGLFVLRVTPAWVGLVLAADAALLAIRATPRTPAAQ
jgi:hypothetical protein